MKKRMPQILDFLEVLYFEETPQEIKDNIRFHKNLGVYILCEDVDSYFYEDEDSSWEGKDIDRIFEERRILDNSKLSQDSENSLKVFSVITADGYVIGTIETRDYSKDKDISDSKVIKAIMNELDNREVFEFLLNGFYQNKIFINENFTEQEELQTKRKISDAVLDVHDQFLNSDDLCYYERLGLYVYRYPYPEFIQKDFESIYKDDVYEYTIFDENAQILGKFKTRDDNYFTFPSEKYVRQVVERNFRSGGINFKKEVIKNFLNSEANYNDLYTEENEESYDFS